MSNLGKKRSSRPPSVRWNEAQQCWMAWVRMPDGSLRTVKRKIKIEAEKALKDLLAERSGAAEPAPKKTRLLTFAEILSQWAEAGYPAPAEEVRHVRVLDANTIKIIRSCTNRIIASDGEEREIQMSEERRREVVKASIGGLAVERTRAETIQRVFDLMDNHSLSTDYIHRSWRYLHHATSYALRMKLISSSEVEKVYLPQKRDAGVRKSFALADVQRIIFEALPLDPQPAMWLVGLICGLRPGEIAGLRWCWIDLDSDEPVLSVEERAKEDDQKYVGQAPPKKGSKRRIKLPPLAVAALLKHRDEQKMLNQYRYSAVPFEADGFVFPNKFGKPKSLKTIRGRFQTFCANAGLADNWTTYELRHSFVSLASDELRDLMAVGEVTGHKDIRTTAGYKHAVRPATSAAMTAWEGILKQDESGKVTPLPIKTA